MGSRGCSILERIVTLAPRIGKHGAPPGRLRVEIIDPLSEGEGLHSVSQPDYLLLNTLCGEISMFPDRDAVGAYAGEAGPSLYEWVTERGLMIAGDGHTVGRTGRPVRPNDFLPRRLLGEYLQWFLARLRERAPSWLSVTVHRSRATSLASDPGSGVRIGLADGSTVGTDYAFLTVGHVPNRENSPPIAAEFPSAAARHIGDPYPIPDKLAVIPPEDSVAVAGFGLSAMDVIAALTVGRGGRFVPDGRRLRYRPGGAEPELLLYSRSGVPFRARPHRMRMSSRFQPLVLTRATVAEFREAGPLDFDDCLFPLLLTEMRIAYHRCRALVEGGADAEAALAAELTGAADTDKLPATLDLLDQLHGPFDPLKAWDDSAAMELHDSAGYQHWLAETIRHDLVEADRGLDHSPLKAALEAVREVRDTLRDAVNFGGLTNASLDRFLHTTVPLFNRAVVGPQKERHAELLALIEARVVRTPFGAAPSVHWNDDGGRWTIASTRLATPHREDVDWLCAGNSPWPAVDSSASPLIRSLHEDGRIRRLLPESTAVRGADVDASLHPVDAAGVSDPRLWLIGPLCEGATFYNHLVPTPGYSRAFVDAHRCVAELFALDNERNAQ
ncbi:FAD/NAD(P)-binding protein [Kitasatospora sp. NPDC057936]|uniref:FAD/NAD(P)-binding protein n=1 Tax=Kitasatospora sp. NPDC057936 TaxID=3346283 RepID=UPI0036D7E3AA